VVILFFLTIAVATTAPSEILSVVRRVGDTEADMFSRSCGATTSSPRPTTMIVAAAIAEDLTRSADHS